MKRLYRVRENKRFQEIRRSGRSYTNELLVLCALPNCLPYSRFGFSVSSRIGNAVTRNRIKRRLREAVRLRMNQIAVGWDVVFIARNPIRSADYHAMESACARLLRRAHLLLDTPPSATTAGSAPTAGETDANVYDSHASGNAGDDLAQLMVKSGQTESGIQRKNRRTSHLARNRRKIAAHSHSHNQSADDQQADALAASLLDHNREPRPPCES